MILGPLGHDYIVTYDSAAPMYDGAERAGIAADHRGMVRFETPAAPGFRMVMGALIRHADEARLAMRQRQADAAMSKGNGVRLLPRAVVPHLPFGAGQNDLCPVDEPSVFRVVGAPKEMGLLTRS